MASNPTDSEPVALNKAMGINDAYGELKRPDGTVPFSINLHATSDIWNKRNGRNYAFQYTGLSLLFYQFVWADGTSNSAAQIGDTAYDFTNNAWFLLGSGKKLIIQSPDLNWWDVTPTVDGEINPTVVATPSTAAMTSDLFVQNDQNFGVTYPTRTVLMGIDREDGIFTLTVAASGGFQVLNDLVFSYASDKHFISEDRHGNRWKLSIDNDGTPTFST